MDKGLNSLQKKYIYKKRLAVIIWIAIFGVATHSTVLKMKRMQLMSKSSLEVGKSQGMKFVTKDGKTLYEHKYQDYTIDKDGKTVPIDSTPEYRAKWMVNLLIAILITAVVFIVILIGTNQNKKLIKELTHIEFEIERLKFKH